MEFKIKDICIINKNSIKKNNYPNIIEYLDTKNLVNGEFKDIINLNRFFDKIPSRAKRLVQKNDILISTVRPNQKHFGFITNMQSNYVVSTGFAVITANQNLVNPYYLYKYFTLEKIINYLQNIAENSTSAYPSIKPSVLGELSIDLPSRNVQNFIANILKSMDDKIDLNKKIIANLEELSQTLFKHWFVDFEFPDEDGNPYKSSGREMIDSELGEIPKGWKISKLDKIINIKSGKRPQNKVNIMNDENKIPVIGASKITGYTSNCLESEPILVIGRVGTHGVIQRFSNNTWPSDNTFIIKSQFMIYTYFILMNIDYKSLNRGSTQPLLSQKDIKNINVVIPESNDLLDKYKKMTDMYFKQIDTLKKQTCYLVDLRDTLLPKLMSGEIEIPDDIEVNIDELSI